MKVKYIDPRSPITKDELKKFNVKKFIALAKKVRKSAQEEEERYIKEQIRKYGYPSRSEFPPDR